MVRESVLLQIGGDQSNLFSLSATELAKLEQEVAQGTLPPPVKINREGPTGGLVRFATVADGVHAALVIS